MPRTAARPRPRPANFVEKKGSKIFSITSGVIPAAQSEETLARFRRAVDAYDDLSLTALHAATTSCGSVVIGLALVEGRISAEEAFALSQLDESFQIEQWGEDEAAMRRRRGLRADIAAAAHFLALLRQG